jgi:hypothetical protein
MVGVNEWNRFCALFKINLRLIKKAFYMDKMIASGWQYRVVEVR